MAQCLARSQTFSQQVLVVRCPLLPFYVCLAILTFRLSRYVLMSSLGTMATFSHMWKSFFFWVDMRPPYSKDRGLRHQVILKIRPMSYFHDGHSMSLWRSSNTPSKKTGYFGSNCAPPVVYRVVFTTFFFVRGKLGVKNLAQRAKLVGWLVG